jgi:hypothetical protein
MPRTLERPRTEGSRPSLGYQVMALQEFLVRLGLRGDAKHSDMHPSLVPLPVGRVV